MDYQSTVQWLFEHGGPVIRYRLAREYGDALPQVDLESLEADLPKASVVQFWLNDFKSFETLADQQKRGEGLGEGGNSSFLHGPADQNIEVVLPKLGQLGLHAGMQILEEKLCAWLERLEAELEHDPGKTYPRDEQFLELVYAHYDHRLIVASSLAQVGCAGHPAVARVIQSRLDCIYEVVKEGHFDIYEAPGKIRIYPKNWGDHVLKSKLYVDGRIRLPFVHDICNFALVYPAAPTETKQKIDAIVKWILSPEHQAFLYNYGYIRCPDGRGKSVGFKMFFPGYFGLDKPDFDPRPLVFRCWQMCRFPGGREHPWFLRSLAHLEQFALAPGIYAFPSNYLREAKGRGYWIHGDRMGLGEDRRRPHWRTIESTFWMFLVNRPPASTG